MPVDGISPGAENIGTFGHTPAGTVSARGAALTDLRSGLEGISNDREGLKKAAKEFESFLIYTLLREMRKTVHKNPLFHGGHAEEMFESFLDMETSRNVSETGGFGLWKILYKDLEKFVPEAPDELSAGDAARATRAYGRSARPPAGGETEGVRATAPPQSTPAPSTGAALEGPAGQERLRPARLLEPPNDTESG